MATVRREKRPRKPWRVDWREGDRQRTRRFATKGEASRFRAQIDSGQRPDEDSRMRLEDWLEAWLRGHGPEWQPVTRRERADRIDKLIVPHLGHRRLAELRPRDVRAFRTAVTAEGATPYAADRAVQVLSAALGAAVKDELLTRNPCAGIGRLYAPVQRRRAAHPLDVERIRAAMPYPRDRVMVSLMAYAGLRPSEMRALRWEDVGDRTIVVRSALGSSGQEKRTKTGSERSVPVIEPVVADLRELHGDDDRPTEGIVAPFHTDHRNWTTRVFRPARRRAGLDGIPPYALRHTFASLLIQQGLNALEVAYLMGHSSPQMVERVYGHLFAEARLGERRNMEEVAMEARHAASSP